MPEDEEALIMKEKELSKEDEAALDKEKAKKWRKGICAFVAWTLTSFLCHQSAKLFLRTGTSDTHLGNGFCWALLITLSQTVMGLLLIDLNITISHTTRSRNVLIVKIVSHVLGTLATNYSMTLVHASSTFVIKSLEPITSAVIQYLVLGIALSKTSVFSIPVIITGAVVFCGSSVNSSMSVLGIFMAFLSNVFLGFRNVAFKMEQNDETMKPIQLRSKTTILLVVLLFTSMVSVMECFTYKWMLPTTLAFLILTATVSSFFHVAFSYISTNVILQLLSVVSHAVANIIKRLLLVLMMYSWGQRQATLANFAGLLICTLGLLVYVFDRTSDKTNRIKQLVCCGCCPSSGESPDPQGVESPLVPSTKDRDSDTSVAGNSALDKSSKKIPLPNTPVVSTEKI